MITPLLKPIINEWIERIRYQLRFAEAEVMANYKHLWTIEKAFRISKTDLRIRPIYHRLDRRIKTHICLAFCSYKLYKELERQLNLKELPYSTGQVLNCLKTSIRRKSFCLIQKRKNSYFYA
ncbi:MAG: hypothetical protein WDO71_26415 [Bacteroidota bacterium]